LPDNQPKVDITQVDEEGYLEILPSSESITEKQQKREKYNYQLPGIQDLPPDHMPPPNNLTIIAPVGFNKIDSIFSSCCISK